MHQEGLVRWMMIQKGERLFVCWQHLCLLCVNSTWCGWLFVLTSPDVWFLCVDSTWCVFFMCWQHLMCGFVCWQHLMCVLVCWQYLMCVLHMLTAPNVCVSCVDSTWCNCFCVDSTWCGCVDSTWCDWLYWQHLMWLFVLTAPDAVFVCIDSPITAPDCFVCVDSTWCDWLLFLLTEADVIVCADGSRCDWLFLLSVADVTGYICWQ